MGKGKTEFDFEKKDIQADNTIPREDGTLKTTSRAKLYGIKKIQTHFKFESKP